MATADTTALEIATPYAQTVDAACAWSGMSRTRLEALMREQQVRAVRAGRRTLVLTASLRAYLDSLPSAR